MSSVLLVAFQEIIFSHPIFQNWLSKFLFFFCLITYSIISFFKKKRYDLNDENFWERSNVYQIVLDLLILAFVVYVIFRKPIKDEKPLSEKVR